MTSSLNLILKNRFLHSTLPQWSYFRYGLDSIRKALLHVYKKPDQFKEYIQLICLPKLDVFLLFFVVPREADDRTRTYDPLITNQPLYQLSYVSN